MLPNLVVSTVTRADGEPISIELTVVPCNRVFLLSPAKAGGPRFQMLLREQARFDLAVKVRQGVAAELAKSTVSLAAYIFGGRSPMRRLFVLLLRASLPHWLLCPVGAWFLRTRPSPFSSYGRLPISRWTKVITRIETHYCARARLLDQHAGPVLPVPCCLAALRAGSTRARSSNFSASVWYSRLILWVAATSAGVGLCCGARARELNCRMSQ